MLSCFIVNFKYQNLASLELPGYILLHACTTNVNGWISNFPATLNRPKMHLLRLNGIKKLKSIVVEYTKCPSVPYKLELRNKKKKTFSNEKALGKKDKIHHDNQ